jgi:medium-chain acyl-[acyl-carrier-protein] hydrolase
MSDNPWLANFRPNPRAGLRLFCFPHAGSSAAAYGLWAEKLPEEIDVWAVEYPGRGSRRPEPPFVRLAALVSAMLPHLQQALTKPFAVFGHSMGGLIAFEVVRRLQLRGGPRPLALVAAGCRAPSRPPATPPIHALPDGEFIAHLASLNGTPASILGDPKLLRLFLPTLRADLQAAETYSYVAGPKLTCPVASYHGASDPEIPVEDLEAWRAETRGPFTRHTFPGDHFFLRTSEGLVMQRLAAGLTGD